METHPKICRTSRLLHTGRSIIVQLFNVDEIKLIFEEVFFPVALFISLVIHVFIFILFIYLFLVTLFRCKRSKISVERFKPCQNHRAHTTPKNETGESELCGGKSHNNVLCI